MSAHCQQHHHDHAREGGRLPAGYRRVLWIALLVNTAMFGIEIMAGLDSGSVSLLADAIDFFGDAANYALTLAVLSLGLVWRARAALLKAASMMAFGVLVLCKVAWSMSQGVQPEPITMGLVGALALTSNLGVAALLYAFRSGDANMRGVWLCTRNDALGNLAVLAAAAGVFGTHSAWPDLIVAVVMGGLALSASVSVLRQANAELSTAHPHSH